VKGELVGSLPNFKVFFSGLTICRDSGIIKEKIENYTEILGQIMPENQSTMQKIMQDFVVSVVCHVGFPLKIPTRIPAGFRTFFPHFQTNPVFELISKVYSVVIIIWAV